MGDWAAINHQTCKGKTALKTSCGAVDVRVVLEPDQGADRRATGRRSIIGLVQGKHVMCASEQRTKSTTQNTYMIQK